MRKNFYRVLGITASATAEEVKVAFRRRAKELHPDQSGLESGPFLEVQEAYAILSDPEQRRRYDDEIFGRPVHQRIPARSADRSGRAEPLESIGRVGAFQEGLFAEFLTRFWGGLEMPCPFEPRPSQDLTIEVAISPKKARFGGTVHVRLPVQTVCPECGGRGSARGHVCRSCDGRGALFGEIPLAFDLPGGVHDYAQIRVPLERYGIPNRFAHIVLRVCGGAWDWI